MLKLMVLASISVLGMVGLLLLTDHPGLAIRISSLGFSLALFAGIFAYSRYDKK